jgi:hypothetical protein
MKLSHVMLIAAFAVPGTAMSAQCDPDMAKAEAGLAAPMKDTVSKEDFEKARELVSKGKALLQAGDDVGCVVAVSDALELMALGGEEG